MMTNDPEDNAASDAAARWAVVMNDSTEGPSASERAEFQRWLLSSERNQREFRVFTRIGATAADLPAGDRARLETEARASLPGRATTSRPFIKWAALAASVLVAVVLGGYIVKSKGLFAESYATHTGETRVVTFEDGSVAYLNTRTKVRWLGNGQDRRVSLVEGEALFDVVHDEAHPFRVMLDNSEIRVLGTRFNVYRKNSGEVVVTVLEGTVQVQEYGQRSGSAEWVRKIRANQQIEYRPIGLMREPHDTEALNAVRWRSGVVKFADEPLPNVLDELTRYTDQRILIRDPRLAEFRVGGALSTRDVRRALSRLEELVPIEVKENNGTFTLDYRPAPAQAR